MPPDRDRYRPTTVNLPLKLRSELQAAADRQLISLSDAIRSACLEAVQRQREEAQDDGR